MTVLTPNCQIVCRDILTRPKEHQISSTSNGRCVKSSGFGLEYRKMNININININIDCRFISNRREIRAAQASSPDLSTPSSNNTTEMESISDCDQLDLILQQARFRKQPIVIDWMANWCRKCIYLKPKLEKLAAEYDSMVKFYCVDVNNVPQGLVKRGNISKMPSIQLWEDGEMKAEVIGGNKAWLVMNEVREMIQPSI